MRKARNVLFLFIVFISLSNASFGQEKRVKETESGTQAQSLQTRENIYKEFEEFVKVIKALQEKYVEELELNTILTNAYRGMLSELDPFSQYISAEELEELKIETGGEFEGLGIEVIVKDGALTVITPILDSPAFKAGILVGDRIIKVDGEPMENMTIREAIKKLRGELGTKTTLTVVHEGEATPVDITIERAKVHVNSIRGARILDEEGKIGYLAVANFQENTIEDMDKVMKDLLERGMKGFILDLRFNPGGLLNIAVNMADRFIEKGVIVSTRGRDMLQNIIYKARKHGTYPPVPMVVLVNNGSASASEIVAGAIKDHERGLLLGIKTFGKGSVQSLIPISDGKAALKLTTARYYTPSGDCIHEKGIEPDIVVPLDYSQMKALHKHLSLINFDAEIKKKEEGQHAPNQTASEKEKSEYVDIQLEKAIDILKGNNVFTKLENAK